ncbi:MAG: DUF2147 domain-containing protein [Legionellaceae bacterium]|nr:DUF2147 domain-containing protein [Legionellaceae bacterium]
MKQFRLALATVMMVALLPFGFAASVSGTWTTIDDADGKKRALVRVSESGGQLSARIVKVISKRPGDTGICSKCPGNFKGKPIAGLTFMWGMKKTGTGEWSGGKILDPKSGKVYNAKVTLKGNKLYVRGYVGVSLLGRTQVWVR